MLPLFPYVHLSALKVDCQYYLRHEVLGSEWDPQVNRYVKVAPKELKLLNAYPKMIIILFLTELEHSDTDCEKEACCEA